MGLGKLNLKGCTATISVLDGRCFGGAWGAYLQNSTYSGAADVDSSIVSGKEKGVELAKSPSGSSFMALPESVLSAGRAIAHRYGKKVSLESLLSKLLERLYRIERRIWAQC